jgi:16S rRNA (guanine527-N7)-methyltransferase
MDQARIADLLQPFLASDQLTPEMFAFISTYIDILLRWNDRINLTAIRDPEEIVTRHFGESLFAARNLFPHASAAQRRESAAQGASRGIHGMADVAGNEQKKTLADVGSGAGFPGIPIKLWRPEIELTLIESNHKKATFLREVTRALTLTDIDIQSVRAETLHVQFDVVTMRAVERFDTILPSAASLVAETGRLALLIGTSQVSLARALLATYEVDEPLAVPQSTSRALLICRSPNHHT